MLLFQKIILTAVVFLLITLLFPPFQEVHPYGGGKNAGYHFILSPPDKFAKIDVAVLLAEWLGIILISGLLLFYALLKSPFFRKTQARPKENGADILEIEEQMLTVAERYDEGEISTVDWERQRIQLERKIRDLYKG